jgi:hypothetical protein
LPREFDEPAPIEALPAAGAAGQNPSLLDSEERILDA